MKWTDTLRIAEVPYDEFQDVDPPTIRFTDRTSMDMRYGGNSTTIKSGQTNVFWKPSSWPGWIKPGNAAIAGSAS
jgi:hypothetical protein